MNHNSPTANNAPPRVGVIVTSYNYGRYLGQALDSLVAQTWTDFEVLIIDDGSTDDTPEVAQAYLGDTRFRYLRTDHVGQPAAKNLGIAATRAPLLGFLDADDRWHPTKLALQMALFEADPELGVAYCLPRVIDDAGRAIDYLPPRPARGWVLPQMLVQNFVCFSSVMVRRDVFDRVGVFNEQIPLAIDYELWLRVAARTRFDYVDQALVDYRTGHANLSSRTEERLQIVLGIMDRFLSDPEHRRSIDPAVIRRAYLDTYGNLALAQRSRSTRAALATYAKGLRQAPWDWGTWRGILSAFLPETARGWLRRMLGKPDWRIRAAAPASSTPGPQWNRSTL